MMGKQLKHRDQCGIGSHDLDRLLFMSALNGYVAYAFTTEQWVNFKI
jgi:hypothetical protein